MIMSPSRSARGSFWPGSRPFSGGPGSRTGGSISIGSATIELDFAKYEAKKNGRPVPLTALEFALLHFLVQNKGRVVHRNEVLDSVWGKDVYVDARTVDKHISLLRKKFEDDPQEPEIHPGRQGHRIQVHGMTDVHGIFMEEGPRLQANDGPRLSFLMEINHEEARTMRNRLIVFAALAVILALALVGRRPAERRAALQVGPVRRRSGREPAESHRNLTRTS